jgi:adenylate kinase
VSTDGGLGLVILGRQGSGKGTQALRLAERYGVVHISTGDMLRAAVAEGSPLGLRARTIMDAGDLVPDDIMCEIVADRLERDDVVTHGFLLDGFPRTLAQAEALVEVAGDAIDLAINLDVPVDEVTRRMVARGRADDTPDAIARRLSLYEEQTEPLLAWFDDRGRLAVVDGIGSETDVFGRLCAAIESLHAAADEA